MRFFCAMPLAAPDGAVLGTLTVLDRIPRTLSRPGAHRARESRHARRRAPRGAAAGGARRGRRGEGRARGQIAADAEERIEHLAREYQRLTELLEEEIGLRRVTEEGLRIEKEFSDAVIQSLPGAFFLVGRGADGAALEREPRARPRATAPPRSPP